MAARTKVRHKKKKICDEDMIVRLPDFGPLEIHDYNRFLELSKVIFYEKWSNPQPLPDSSQIISLLDLETIQILGMGGFGFVTLVRHKPSEKLFAVKCNDKEKVVKNHQLESLKTEQLLLQCFNHPFINYLLCTLQDNSYVYFVLPFVEGKELYRHLKRIGKFDEDLSRFYASQVILALEYIHYLDFIYRDVKPENVLIDHNGYLKLTDFGFTKRIKRRLRTYTLCGTPEYMAPEVILNKGYGKAVDWWSIGVFIYEMAAGKTPFAADDAMRVNQNIILRRYKTPNFFSPDLCNLVDNLLQTDLSKRLGNLKNGVLDIKQHRWLYTINWLAIFNRKVEAPYKPPLSMELEELPQLKLPKAAKENKYSIEFSDF